MSSLVKTTAPGGMAVAVLRSTGPDTGVELVTFQAALPPLFPNGPAILEDLARRLAELAPLIVTEALAASDPRLQIDAGALAQLELVATLPKLDPNWLRVLVLELLELRKQCSRELRPLEENEYAEELRLTALERLDVARDILRSELVDSAGNPRPRVPSAAAAPSEDLRYALEQLETAITQLGAAVVP